MALSATEIESAIRVILGRAPRGEDEVAQLRAAHRDLAGVSIALMRGHEAQARIAHRVRDQEKSLGDFSAVRTVFMHIPKTAGTTVRNILTANFAREAIFPDTSFLATYPANLLAGYLLFVGHYSLAAIQHIPGEKRIFTLLREPRDRLLSYYRFLGAKFRNASAPRDRLAGKFDLSPEKFFADPEVRATRQVFNMQTRYLCCLTPEIARKHGIDRGAPLPFRSGADMRLAAEIAMQNLHDLAGFGLVEQFDDFVTHVIPALGLTPPKAVRSANVTDHIHGARDAPVSAAPGDAPSEELSARLEELIAADRMVYDYARTLFAERYLDPS